MTFDDFIKHTLLGKNDIDWDYYSSAQHHENLFEARNAKKFITTYFERGGKTLPLLYDPNEARRFISEYFDRGQKKTLLSFERCEELILPDDRAKHTVSIFFLGLLIENCINGKKSLSFSMHSFYPFSYFWFLTSLYHDYGYCVSETDCSLIRPVEGVPSVGRFSKLAVQEKYAINKMKNTLSINLSPLDYMPSRSMTNPSRISLENAVLRELDCLAKRQLVPLGLPKLRYSHDTIFRYFNYCNNERNRADHGIIGGYLFYDRMLKNYLYSYLKQNRIENTYCDPNDFVYRNRHFCSEQLSLFLHIANCIMEHNIWKQSPKYRTQYEKYHLDQLYQENYKKICYKENPLLYILVIADSIDPIKAYKLLPAEEVISAIEMDYNQGKGIIEFSTVGHALLIDVLYERAKGLEEWVDVLCSPLEGNKFSICLQCGI